MSRKIVGLLGEPMTIHFVLNKLLFKPKQARVTILPALTLFSVV